MQEPCGAHPVDRRRAHRHLEPRRGRDGPARRRRGRGGREGAPLGADDAARRRLVPDEDRRRRGRGRPRRRQHDRLPRRGPVAPLAGASATSASCSRYWPSVRAALDWVVAAAAFGARWAGWVNDTPTEDDCAPDRLIEHLPVAARRRGPRRPARRPAARVGADRRPARPRAARAPRPVRGQVDVLDGLVLPGPRRRRPRRRPASSCSRPAGTTSSCPASASTASTPTRG